MAASTCPFPIAAIPRPANVGRSATRYDRPVWVGKHHSNGGNFRRMVLIDHALRVGEVRLNVGKLGQFVVQFVP